MHQEVMNFLGDVKREHPGLFSNVKVVEYGSYDVNGSVRQFFDNSDVTGVDWRDGPLVDVISLMHEFQADDESFDVAISASAIEHDPFWRQSLSRCMELLKKDGSLIVTCGGPKYEKHCENTSPTGDGYYSGISAENLILHVGPSFKLVDNKSDLIGRDVFILFKGKI